MKDEEKSRTQLLAELAELRRRLAELETTEQAIRESEQKLRLIFENAFEGVSIYEELPNKSRRLIDCNERYAEMAGRSKEELLEIGNTNRIQKKLDLDMGMSKILKLRREKIAYKGLFSWIRPDGKENIIEYTAAPVQVRGKPLTIGFDRDITERKQMEERLRRSEKMSAVGQMAGGIAHYFNNMLTTILGYTELALAELGPGHRVSRDLHIIRETTQRAAGLTQQLLSLTRYQVAQPRTFDLNGLIQGLAPTLYQLIGEEIHLEMNLSPASGQVHLDPNQTEQILIHLVTNARDAMPQGGKLVIETANVNLAQTYTGQYTELDPGCYVVMAVRDNGIGISDEVKAHLFEPFFTTKEIGQGTGLGLATCLGIIKQNEGHIVIESEAGQGTTVKVYLPSFEERLGEAVTAVKISDSPKGTETILLVEDDLGTRSTIGRLLRVQGYTVLEAANGNQALQIIQEQEGRQIHLLLTDVIMPHMGGKTLANRLRFLRPDIKVLFISGYEDNVVVQQGIPDLETLFLRKPFAPDRLLWKVRKVLDAVNNGL